jgi:hypothetical protein
VNTVKICKNGNGTRGPIIKGGTLRGERDGGWIQHHTSYGDLRASAAGGCELCNVLRQGLQHWADWVLQERTSRRQQDQRQQNQQQRDQRQQESDLSDSDAYHLRKDLEIGHKYFLVLNLTYPRDSSFYLDHIVFEGFYYRRCLPDLIYPSETKDNTIGACFTFKTLIG